MTAKLRVLQRYYWFLFSVSFFLSIFSVYAQEEVPEIPVGEQVERVREMIDRGNTVLERADDLIQSELRPLFQKLNSTAENLESITEKVDKGEGTLGVMVNDDELAHKSTKVVSKADNVLEKFQRMGIDIGASGALLTDDNESRADVYVRWNVERDKYLLLGVTHRSRPIPAQAESELNLNVQLAKRLDTAVVRAGIFEGTGGLAVDYSPWPEFGLGYIEAYRLSENNPQLNIGARVNVYGALKLWLGADGLNIDEHESFFVGAAFELSVL